jgi:bifunctional UDP-N-acetylglucosamine pyrophosphorylase / glucosamine-1-phosphate N-acetyltransferase
VKNPDVVIVLAAGEGTRMKSATPKVLHPIAGRSILGHLMAAIAPVTGGELRVVVGAHREFVEAEVIATAPAAIPVYQAERNGTGHAVQLALAGAPTTGSVLILAGDTPLLTTSTLNEFIAIHEANASSASVLTADMPDPFGYGRIIRDDNGGISHIVEERDATDEEREITEINTGVYLFDNAALRAACAKLSKDNSQGELYLTDVIALIKGANSVVLAIRSNDYTETLGINDRSQLAECTAVMRDRINDRWMKSGVTIVDPTTTWIDVDVTIESDVTIHPGTSLAGNTAIATGAVIGPRTTLTDVFVDAGAHVIESTCTGSHIGAKATVGPYTFLRAGTTLGAGAKAGAYVEIKNSTVGDGSKVPHLSYVGDATIGSGTNIGAATIFVNYDGVDKHQTIVGDEVRIGSDTMLVAPVSIGDGAYTAAGSIITEDVPAGSIGVARAKQRNVLGWVLRKRAGSSSAIAAKRAGATERE